MSSARDPERASEEWAIISLRHILYYMTSTSTRRTLRRISSTRLRIASSVRRMRSMPFWRYSMPLRLTDADDEVDGGPARASDDDCTVMTLLLSASESRRTRSCSRVWIDSSSCATGLDIPEFFLFVFRRRSDDADVAFVVVAVDAAVDDAIDGGVDIAEVLSIPVCCCRSCR